MCLYLQDVYSLFSYWNNLQKKYLYIYKYSIPTNEKKMKMA